MAHERTPEEWAAIKADHDAGGFTMKALSEKHQISPSAITTHRAKHGWTNPKTGEPYGMSAKQKATLEPIPEGEQAGDPDLDVNAKVAEITAAILAPEEESELEQVQRELEEAKAELANYKPVTVEWPVDCDTAAKMLASELNDMVQMSLNSINDDRIKRNLPFWTVEDMDKARPGWSQTIRETIIQDTVDDLTRWATNEGPSLHKIDMLRPDGVSKEQIPVGPNIDNGQRPQRLLGRGWRTLEPQSCRRWNCYGPLPKGDPYEGFHSQLHKALFDWQYPQPDRGVTTSAVFEG